MIRLVLVAASCLLVGCSAVRYNGPDLVSTSADYPAVGKPALACVGDRLVEKGTVVEEYVLVVHESLNKVYYNIPAGTYRQIGSDANRYYYSAVGVTAGFLVDPVQALAVSKTGPDKLMVMTSYAVATSYSAKMERKKVLSDTAPSFRQSLIYGGKAGDKIKLGYREFSSDPQRPALNQDVEYDLSGSRTVGYKGAMIEVMAADGNTITYRLIRSFP